MELKEFDILLDIKKSKKIEDIEVVQKDYESNVFNISIVEDFKPYNLAGLNVEIAFAKSDGTTVLQDENNGVVIVSAIEGKVICTLKTNTIAAPGKVLAEVRILQDLKLLTTARFDFFVRKAIVDDETIKSTNEFPILNEKIEEVDDLIKNIEQMIANGELDGKSLEFHWDGTQLGIRVEGQANYQYVNLKGDKGDQGIQGIQGEIGPMGPSGKNLEFTWNGTQLGVRQEGQSVYQYVDLKGDKGERGLRGLPGKNLEFHWNGTSLGVRVEGETEYIYVDLKGETGDIENLTVEHIINALGYTPANDEDIVNLQDEVNANKQENVSQYEELKYSELSSTATNIDDEGIYQNIEWKRKDNTLYAKSTLIGTYPYSQIKIDYYDEIGTTIVKTITWDLTYDDNDFPYVRMVI